MNYGNKFLQIYITAALLPVILGYAALCAVLYGIAAITEEIEDVWGMNQ